MKATNFFSLLIFSIIFFNNSIYAEDLANAFQKTFEKDGLKYSVLIPQKRSVTTDQYTDFHDLERVHLHREESEWQKIKAFYEKFTPCLVTIQNTSDKKYDSKNNEILRLFDTHGQQEALQWQPHMQQQLENASIILNQMIFFTGSTTILSFLLIKMIEGHPTILAPLCMFSLLGTSVLAFGETILEMVQKNMGNPYFDNQYLCDLIQGQKEKNSFSTIKFIKKDSIDDLKQYFSHL